MKKLVMILFIAAMTTACGDLAQAELDIPANGTFDIIIDPCDGPGVSFDPMPYTGSLVYLFPFASEDGSYTSPFSDYNLAFVSFQGGSIDISDFSEQEGDLGIRVDNISGSTQTLDPSVLTLDFDEGSFDVFLPGFTFDTLNSMFFWIAESHATYYANSSKDVGSPNITASEAMAAGDEYLARTPEPATVVLFGLGALLLRRRGKAGSD
jgi:hypothetical protein